MNGTIVKGNAHQAPRTNPSVYNAHHERFTSQGLPKDAAGWIRRAQDVARILSEDAAQRDIDNKSPFAEVSLLKSAGLLKVLGPPPFGGGQSWEVGCRIIRETAKGDGYLITLHVHWCYTEAFSDLLECCSDIICCGARQQTSSVPTSRNTDFRS